MSAIRRFLVGKNLTVATIQPCTVADDGVITVGTAKSLIGRIESMRISLRANTEMIMSVDDVLENHVLLYDGYQIEIGEIQVQKTTGTGALAYENVLPVMYSTRDYFKIVLTKGGNTYTIYALRSSMDDGIQGQGKQNVSMTLLPVNVNIDATSTASLLYV